MSRYQQGGYGNRGSGGGYRPGDRGGSPQQGERSLSELWPGYLKGGYFDAEGNLRLDYVSREKVEPLVKAMCQAQPKLTPNQIRRYFGHCRAIETRLRSMSATWGEVHPQVKKLDIAAADGASKASPKIPKLFHEFIKRNVDKIASQKDFLEGFLPHFEAIVGFGQAHFDKGRN